MNFVELQEYYYGVVKSQIANHNILLFNNGERKTESLGQTIFSIVSLFKAYINEARAKFPNKKGNKNCIKATNFLLPYIQQTFSDAKRYDFIVSDNDNIDPSLTQHSIILANENTIIVDSQLEQFQDLLELPETFVQAGIYDADTYWSLVTNKQEVLL